MPLPGKPSGISQTSFIFASVFVLYLVFITLRGDLAKWMGVFGFGAASGAVGSAIGAPLAQINPLASLTPTAPTTTPTQV